MEVSNRILDKQEAANDRLLNTCNNSCSALASYVHQMPETHKLRDEMYHLKETNRILECELATTKKELVIANERIESIEDLVENRKENRKKKRDEREAQPLPDDASELTEMVVKVHSPFCAAVCVFFYDSLCMCDRDNSSLTGSTDSTTVCGKKCLHTSMFHRRSSFVSLHPKIQHQRKSAHGSLKRTWHRRLAEIPPIIHVHPTPHFDALHPTPVS